MPRVRMLTTRDDVPPSAHETFEAIAESRGRISGPFAVLLHAPEIAGRTAHLGAYIRFEGVLPAAVRELATLATAHGWGCAYEWAAHEPQARNAGVDEAAIQAVATDGALDRISADDALVIRVARDLVTNHLLDTATFEAAQARFGEQGVVELIATVGYYSMLACVLNAAEVVPSTSA
jgi:4-carboxymuconolactone decarboxylase